MKRRLGLVLVAAAVLTIAALVARTVVERGALVEQGVRWEEFSEGRLAEARDQAKPVLLYFTDDWCRPCRAFQRGTLRDARVVAAAEPFVRLVVDLTDSWSQDVARLRSAYQVAGVPLTMVLGPDGSEVRRVVGNVPASVLLDALRAATPAP